MKYYIIYVQLCKFFHNKKFPKLKFRELKERYKLLYQKNYGIEEEDVNKASFFIFLICFITMIVISFFLFDLNITLIVAYSVILAIVVSYRFNSVLIKKFLRSESRINTILNFIKLDYALLQKTLKQSSDFCLSFIVLMTNYDITLSKLFKEILKKILEGKSPEVEISEIITPSKDFNEYLKDLIMFNFKSDKLLNNKIELQSSEKSFKIFLKQVQNKISIFFFFGVFYPIGLYFLVLFQPILVIYVLFTIPIFFLIFHYFYNKHIKGDINLVGILTEQSKLERKKFQEFLKFIKKYAVNLKENISQELALIKTYYQNKIKFKVLRVPLRNQINNLITNSISFNEMIDFLKLDLKSTRYKLILDNIKNFVNENAFYTSEKILDIIKIIQVHRKLEEKLIIIIKGEKFKVFIYLFLLPIIVGAIGGFFPFFKIINLEFSLSGLDVTDFILQSSNLTSYIMIFIILLSNLIITSYYFLKIINQNNKKLLIILVISIFILFFISSFMIFLNIVKL